MLHVPPPPLNPPLQTEVILEVGGSRTDAQQNGFYMANVCTMQICETKPFPVYGKNNNVLDCFDRFPFRFPCSPVNIG